jgi:sirohydrochlorin ferrochelatase
MKAILLVAHGSRREASNDEVRQLAARLQTIAAQQSREVRAAFLELAEPSIPDGIQQCIDNGATEVVVLPYFLSAGRHVAADIPAEVKIKQDQHPDINISIAPYLGSAPAIDNVLMSLV